ncbi:MAG TPA: DUF2255 family protein [Candidatus Binatia bacterium]|jgi:hypothetical protein|nr:DUF2255 family protein [Candidatus Binatia bacterium]
MWTTEELEKIAAADELQISSLRRDGTLSKSVTIWVVRHGDDLYVRSAYGRGSAWFRAAEERHEGHISAGGVEKIVRFVAGADGADDAIDAAYRAKYSRYPAVYVEHVTSPDARATTIKLVPSDA